MENSILITASFLHPFYKDFPHTNDSEQIKLKEKAIIFLSVLDSEQPVQINENEEDEKNNAERKIDQSISGDESDDSFYEKKINRNEKKSVLQQEIESYQKVSSNTIDFSKFWNENSNNYPILSEYARIFLSIPATSCSSKRIFSNAGNQVWSTRNKLSSKNLEKISFIFEGLNK